jgi:hypothetical protein
MKTGVKRGPQPVGVERTDNRERDPSRHRANPHDEADEVAAPGAQQLIRRPIHTAPVCAAPSADGAATTVASSRPDRRTWMSLPGLPASVDRIHPLIDPAA